MRKHLTPLALCKWWFVITLLLCENVISTTLLCENVCLCTFVVTSALAIMRVCLFVCLFFCLLRDISVGDSVHIMLECLFAFMYVRAFAYMPCELFWFWYIILKFLWQLRGIPAGDSIYAQRHDISRSASAANHVWERWHGMDLWTCCACRAWWCVCVCVCVGVGVCGCACVCVCVCGCVDVCCMRLCVSAWESRSRTGDKWTFGPAVRASRRCVCFSVGVWGCACVVCVCVLVLVCIACAFARSAEAANHIWERTCCACRARRCVYVRLCMRVQSVCGYCAFACVVIFSIHMKI